MNEYLRIFRAARAGEYAVSVSADSAVSPQNRPIGTNCTICTGASAENRVPPATPDRVVVYVDFAARGAAAYARWQDAAEAGDGAP